METLTKDKKAKRTSLKIERENLSEKTMSTIRNLIYERSGLLETKTELLKVAILVETEGMDFLQKRAFLYPIEWANNFIDQVLSDIGFEEEKGANNLREEIRKENLSEKSISLLRDYVDDPGVMAMKTNLHELLRNTIVYGLKEITPDEIEKIFFVITALNDLADSLYKDAIEVQL